MALSHSWLQFQEIPSQVSLRRGARSSERLAESEISTVQIRRNDEHPQHHLVLACFDGSGLIPFSEIT